MTTRRIWCPAPCWRTASPATGRTGQGSDGYLVAWLEMRDHLERDHGWTQEQAESALDIPRVVFARDSDVYGASDPTPPLRALRAARIREPPPPDTCSATVQHGPRRGRRCAFVAGPSGRCRFHPMMAETGQLRLFAP